MIEKIPSEFFVYLCIVFSVGYGLWPSLKEQTKNLLFYIAFALLEGCVFFCSNMALFLLIWCLSTLMIFLYKKKYIHFFISIIFTIILFFHLGWSVLNTPWAEFKDLDHWEFYILMTSFLVRGGFFPFHVLKEKLFFSSKDLGLIPYLCSSTNIFILLVFLTNHPNEISLESSGWLMVLFCVNCIYMAIRMICCPRVSRLVSDIQIVPQTLVCVYCLGSQSFALEYRFFIFTALFSVNFGLYFVFSSFILRFGDLSLKDFGQGFFSLAPNLSYAFLFFGLIGLCLPGSSFFFIEDLFIESLVEHHAMISLIILLSSLAIMNVAFLYHYFSIFSGLKSGNWFSFDLVFRERFCLGILCGLPIFISVIF